MIPLNQPYAGIILAGPTACGKSFLALELAQRLSLKQPAEIINADSMQVYSELSIITARPTPRDCALIPHHLYGIVNLYHHGSVGWWLSQAEQQIASCHDRNILPIIVGGTGLYLRALTQGLTVIPEIDKQIRYTVRELSKQLGNDFYSYVCRHDPLIENRLKVNDHQRLGRALEVFLQTGQSISWWQDQTYPSKYSFLYCVIAPARKILYRNISQRFEKMIQQGVLEEVERLQDYVLPPDSPVLKAIGVKELGAFIKGEWSLKTAIEQAQINSRQYAKRQLTWFRHQVDKKIVIEVPDVNILWSAIIEITGDV
jgi:tRNA dimethylallyltransferase